MDSPFLQLTRQFEAMPKEEQEKHNAWVEEERRKDAERAYNEKIQGLRESCGLGEKFTKRTFETFTVTDENKGAYEYFKDYAENFDNKILGIYAWGLYGVGKTHLAAAVANYLLKKGRRVLLLPMTNFKEQIFKSFGDGSTGRILTDIAKKELVIFDDFDKLKTRGGEWDSTKELVYSVINRLYEAERKVIVTANCNRAELEDVYDASISSRIAEMCDCREMKGKDWRLK